MSKSSQQQIFESIIASSIKRLQDHYSQTNKQELEQFKERLKLLDKGVKELDANPYFFLFIYMVATNSPVLIQEALKSIEILLSEHFLNPSKSKQLSQNLGSLLRKTIPLKPQQSATIITQLTHPNIETFQLIFQVLQYTQSQRVESSGINLLGRLFEFKYVYNHDFQRKVAVQFEPSKRIEYGYQLITAEEQNQLLTYYVKKMVVDMVDKIEVMQGEAVKGTGKFGFCFMCRELADHYCKDTKVSVCSSHCKKAHLEQLQKVSMGTVHYPIEDKQNIQRLLFQKLSTSQNSNVRSFILWCLIKILSLSDYTLGQRLVISDLVTDSLDFKRNLLHFYYLYSLQRKELCQNIFHNLFLYSQNQEYLMLLQSYFIELFSDVEFLKVYYNFDMQTDRISIIKQILFHASTRPNRKIALMMMEQMLETVRNSHPEIILSQDIVVESEQNNNLVTLFNGNDKGAFEEEISKRDNKGRALFVYKNQRYLNKEKVATYLSKQKNVGILSEYLNLLDLNSLELEGAIREVFFHISPRQSQQIYRLLVEFCKIYQCPRLPKEEDLLLFCYLIIMIQTELHNPIVEKRTTFEQMVKRVSDFNKTLSEDTEYMTLLYRNIQNRPFSQTTKTISFKQMKGVAERETPKYHPAIIIYENWQTIYVSVSADLSNKSLELAYKSAVFLIKFKAAQHFFHLIFRELYQRQLTEPFTPTLFRYTLDLILRDPNHVEKQWAKIFFFLYRYENLRENVTNGTRPDLEKELLIASSYILDDHIIQIFEISQILEDSQLVFFCEGISTIPLIYFLHQVPVIVELNFHRLHVFWKALSAYIGIEQNYIFKATCLSEIILVMYTVKEPKQENINTVIKDSLSLLEWAPDKQSQFFEFVVTIINNCGKMFTNEVWHLLFSSMHKLSVNKRIVLSSILKQSSPIFVEFIVADARKNQSLQFLEANKATIIDNPTAFEPEILKYKNQQVIRFFLMNTFREFIIKNVDSLPPTKELYSILTSTDISPEHLPQLETFLSSHLGTNKNVESQSIYLIIHLMSTTNKQKGFELFQRILNNNKIEVSEYQKDFLNTDPESKPTKKDYDTLVRKTLNQVTILNCLSQQVSKISNDILEQILVHIDSLISSSVAFNRNIPLRHYLWKNGLVKSLKQLPGLLKTERSSEMVRFSIWNKLGDDSHGNKIVNRWNEITERLVTILKELREREKGVAEDEIKTHNMNEIERELADYKKLLPKLFPCLKEMKWERIEKQNKVRWLNSCCRMLTNGLFSFKQESVSQARNADEETLGTIFQLVTSSL